MSENIFPQHFPRTESDIFKCLAAQNLLRNPAIIHFLTGWKTCNLELEGKKIKQNNDSIRAADSDNHFGSANFLFECLFDHE